MLLQRVLVLLQRVLTPSGDAVSSGLFCQAQHFVGWLSITKEVFILVVSSGLCGGGGASPPLCAVALMPPANNNRKRSASKHKPSSNKKHSVSKLAKKAAAGKTPTKSTVTQPLSSLGFSSSKRPKYHVGTKVLLDDSIYDDKVPEEVKGHFFVYEIVSTVENGKSVMLQYKDQVIRAGGDSFWVYIEGTDPQVRLQISLCVVSIFYMFCLTLIYCPFATCLVAL